MVPLAQKRTVGDVTVALSSLELHAEGLGVLHWRVSLGEGALRAQPDFAHEIPEPFFEIRDGAGHVLPWSPSGSAASVGESHGEVEVRDLAAGVYESDGDHLGEGACVEGPWVFRFTL